MTLGRAHFVIAALFLLGVATLDVLGVYPSAASPGAPNASVRENPASYRPVYIPRGGGSSGGSGGWSGGK